ncbi:PREDICTED: uncharacterized protein LOC105455757 isoform X1 [Wasmannia auropunctata]|uniref:uncharacterized protein LOC105455757 isoform X1 n=1 Tax=Wasmannia auropunctata TaxID=64793 RepID=UPI0005EDFA40|nr:PREDICTED: uncharacterized protein LOC105455757 isoform X1 [Wasmannia auropunctata]
MSSDKIGKLCKRASRSRSRSLERTLPICHRGPQYPPGCTVLECRFEADRPIARIVQVPADTAATARNSCLRVKRSSDSFSRMKPRRKDVKQRGSADVCSQKSDKFILLPASCTLKSHDRIDDSITLTGKIKIPIKTVSSAILKIDKSKKRLDDSSSRILRSLSKNILRASHYDDKSAKQPLTVIKYFTMPKDSLARDTRCPSKTSESGRVNYRIHLESKLKKDSSCKIIQPVTDSKRMISDKKSRVCDKRSSHRALSKLSVSRRKSKPEVTRSPPDCKVARPGRADLKIDILFFPETRDPLSQITRKNGLVDPSEIPCSTKKLSGKYKRQICPVSCCQPVQPAIKDVCSEFPRAKSLALDAKSSSTEMSSEKILRAEVTRIKSAKWDRKSTCQKPAVPFRRACSPEKISEDITRLREPSSRELFTRYKGYIPIYQLERYEACRSKRNGLQDECIPPLLRSILQKEKQQRTGKCFKRNVDQLDLRGMSESVNRNQPQILLYVE